MARPDLESAIADLGIVITAVFVPWSRSRNASEPRRSLNWKVRIARHGRTMLTTNYSAGIGHCPAYTDARYGTAKSVDRLTALTHETEHGTLAAGFSRRPILPDFPDVLWAFLQDATVLDFPTFEAWASEYGYDTDSRKAERVYTECLRDALALRNAFTPDEWQRLQTATEGY
jgi:hypothetical protein